MTNDTSHEKEEETAKRTFRKGDYRFEWNEWSMGAAGSSNGAPSSAPFREESNGENAFIYGTEESSRCPEYANENIRQRTRSTTFDVGEEPRSQGPSPYATIRGEEWWSQRPSAPSLSNLRPSPRRETLLTYAAQMTGWQTAEGHGPPSFPQYQEAMELSKVVSQLAMANQQLASAHTATLAHLEALYVELRKLRETRRKTGSSETLDETLKKRLTVEHHEEDDESRRIESRVDRLENLLIGEQRTISQEDGDRKLRLRIERLESIVKSRGLDRFICDSLEDRRSVCGETTCSRLPSSIDVPELDFKTRISNDEARTMSRISVTQNEQGTEWVANDETDSQANLHLENTKKTESNVEELRRSVIRLTDEVERLEAERLEYQGETKRLANDLVVQKALVKKLKKDNEESRKRHEEVETNLKERREEHEKLMARFDVATKETERLLKEIDGFNALKDTAEARISSLEQDLQRCLWEKEQIRDVENERTSKLKAQLSEEVSDKKKQTKALEDALDEIQRLKEIVKTEAKGHSDESSKDIAIDDPQESPPDRATNIEEFKKELTLKREARQRAIAAVSSEMERLRRELDAEKEAHSETSKVLDLLRSAQNEQAQTVNETSNKSTAKHSTMDDQELAVQRMEAKRLMSILKVSDEVRNDIRVQIDKLDDLRYQLETDTDHHRQRIRCLSDMSNRTREAVYARERHTNELKDRLAEILERLGDKSFLEPKDEVGLECERQMENINCLKSLYNERLKLLNELKDAAVRDSADTRVRLDHSLKERECLEEDLKKADEKIDAQDTAITNLESQLGLTKADCRDLQNQMSLINGLFTQMLLGANSADMDLDRLTQLLQENHDLICDMAREEGTEAAALPKLLLDLIEQVEGNKGPQKHSESDNAADSETEKKDDDLQQEDIAHNLPKVWRVLLELLSCHAEGAPSTSAASFSDPNICYKSVDTPAGPRLVISVSKTYIRLKELILEKKHLEKEMNRMKQLNTHLESKLGEQMISGSPQESLNPLDQALTNVIQNLIVIDENITSTTFSRTTSNEDIINEDHATNDPEDRRLYIKPWTTSNSVLPKLNEDTKEVPIVDVQQIESESSNDLAITTENADGEKAKSEESPKSIACHTLNVTSTQPVFSIGPFPPSIVTPSTVKNVQFSDPLIVGPSNRFSAPVFGASLTDGQFPSTFNTPASSDAEFTVKHGTKIMENVDSDNVSVESSSSLETIKECPVPSSSSVDKKEISSAEVDSSKQEEKKLPIGKIRTPEEALAAREDRLKRLEEQAKWLMNKMNATSRRGSALSTRLEELHEAYGEPPVPPPMPDVLPSRRLKTSLPDLPRQVSESSSTEDANCNTEKPVSSDESNESSPNNAS
ncbi:putative leucine-rich repeat-containing protein DDB_G0290503 [Ceratina calcarata]|uniref:Leucine-rich repeat-containing protein DDB_G0290503 n=1 Tax=Ceratina calcarata TaxID=156304 RepID=A0AAJ7JB92_9HYME|nr:putative leucine-rich repeat-containing protein DDB_G0290503 [Ceratina calcarata]